MSVKRQSLRTHKVEACLHTRPNKKIPVNRPLLHHFLGQHPFLNYFSIFLFSDCNISECLPANLFSVIRPCY